MPYIYQADIWCDDCGKAIKEQIREYEKKTHDRVSREDSDQWPIELDSISDEADSPQHCGSMEECPNAERFDGRLVGQFLENNLTTDGYEYVLEQHREHPSGITQMWMDFYNLSLSTEEEEENEEDS